MSPRTAGEGLLHPVAVAAVAVLAVNDQWGKAAFPGLVTGKLSDVAGLLFFPLFLQAAIEVAQARRRDAFEPSRRLLVGLAVLTGLCFALVKLSPVGAEAYRVVFGALRWPLDAAAAWLRGASAPALSRVSLTMDASDLIALPALALSVALGWSRRSERPAPRTPARDPVSDGRLVSSQALAAASSEVKPPIGDGSSHSATRSAAPGLRRTTPRGDARDEFWERSTVPGVPQDRPARPEPGLDGL